MKSPKKHNQAHTLTFLSHDGAVAEGQRRRRLYEVLAEDAGPLAQLDQLEDAVVADARLHATQHGGELPLLLRLLLCVVGLLLL